MRHGNEAPPASRVAVGQMNPDPGNVEANLAHIESIVRATADAGAKLVVLPGTATTGYVITDRLAELAEADDGPTSARLGQMA